MASSLNNTLNILLITQHYKPEPNFITADIAERLVKHGFNVTVLTAHPNYPLGKFYKEWFSILPKKTFENGVKVWRMPFFADHSPSKIRRFISYVSFAFVATIFAPFIIFKPKGVIVYQAPFTSALASLFFRLIYRSRLIYLCTDLWPESFTASGISTNKWLLDILYGYSRWINQFADQLITSTRGIMKRYATDGIGINQMEYLPVWVDGIPTNYRDSLINSKESTASTKRQKKGFNLVYAGNFGPAQNLETIILAAQILKEHCPDIRFSFFGTGSEEQKLKSLAAHLSLSSVSFYGRVTPDVAFKNISEADGNIIHLKDSEYFRLTLPSKIASALASGTPILCGAIGETAQVAQESEASIIFEPGNPDSLANSIRKLYNMTPRDIATMRHKSWNYYERHFSREMLIEKYCATISNTILS